MKQPVAEDAFQRAVIEAAQTLGWRVAHFRPAKTARGWRTPVEADGAGFPDLVLVREGILVAAELKSERGLLSNAQIAWLDAFQRVCFLAPGIVQAYVWRPSDWPLIESILKGGDPT